MGGKSSDKGTAIRQCARRVEPKITAPVQVTLHATDYQTRAEAACGGFDDLGTALLYPVEFEHRLSIPRHAIGSSRRPQGHAARAVFGRIGGRFVQGHRETQCGTRVYFYGIARHDQFAVVVGKGSDDIHTRVSKAIPVNSACSTNRAPGPAR